MNNYDDGFRYITIYGEDKEKTEKLNDFLSSNEYEYEESKDGLKLAVKEFVYTSEDNTRALRAFISRMSEEEAEEYEDSFINQVTDQVAGDFFSSAEAYTVDNLANDMMIRSERDGE